jgi:1-phosphofructokinase
MSSSPHIFTLTGNLLAERTLEFERWAPGRTQRAVRESFQVGGKGINVSRMLTRLGIPNTAVCFTGGASGAECEKWMRQRGVASVLQTFSTLTPTRVGIVVRDVSGTQADTTFLGPDAAADPDAIEACANFLNAQAAGDVLALCGSFPGWSSPHFARLRTAVDRWQARGDLVVDTYGPPLADLVNRPLALLKINQDELRSLNLPGTAAVPLHIRRVIITDGPRAVFARDADGTAVTFTPPIIREVSSTGSGDVLLACVLEALFVRKLPLDTAVAFAIPYAAANAGHPGVAEFPLPRRDS